MVFVDEYCVFTVWGHTVLISGVALFAQYASKHRVAGERKFTHAARAVHVRFLLSRSLFDFPAPHFFNSPSPFFPLSTFSTLDRDFLPIPSPLL